MIAALMAATLAMAPGAARLAFAAVTGQAGPYRVEVRTNPPVIPVGKVRMTITLSDTAGKPVEDASVRAIVQMPGMQMGEKETRAAPVPGSPGEYETEAAFMMAGAYEATVTIDGPAGAATARIPLETGMDTAGAGGGFPYAWVLAALLAAALAAFVIHRMRRTGQRVNWRAALRPATLAELLLIGVMIAIAVYGVRHWRRPGAMTPIEAQAMEMETPPPPGTAPVTLATVTRGPFVSTVRYTGQAVGYNERDVIARAQGWIVWMPFYAGDRVKDGQLLARLDTSQQNPQVARQEAAVAMARQGVGVAEREHRQALAGVSEARALVAARRDGQAGAQADVAAARADRADAAAELEAAGTRVEAARAGLQAAEADWQYWQQELEREKMLLERGAVSREEYQREAAQASASEAKLKQARSEVAQAQAQVRSAQARVARAEAAIAAAGRKASQAASEIRASEAAVRSAEAAASAARQRIAQSGAAVAQARAELSGAATAREYSEVRAQGDGVVTERVVSPGTLVNPGQAILRVAQVRPIRLQANVAESDLSRIRPGARVLARGPDAGKRSVVARVTSIAPAVDPISRTGLVEALHANSDGRFVPGQYVVMDIAIGGSEDALSVPTAAIRTRVETAPGAEAEGTTSYVWVASPAADGGERTVRAASVRVGASERDMTRVLSGLREGQQVVVEGGEGLHEGDTVTVPEADQAPEARPAMPGHEMPAAPGHEMPGAAGANEATVEVSSRGFTPDRLTVRAGVPARVTFVRKDEQNCGQEVLLPEYGIRKALPLNQPVTIEFTPRKGELEFTCGMKMLRGKVVAR